jgi:large subunit ribosomal protein L31
MKKDLHPQLFDLTVRCVCGHAMNFRSTKEDIRASLCSACHPFYTGAQKYVDSAGRIEKWERKFGNYKKKA